jgi:hypothetical protein
MFRLMRLKPPNGWGAVIWELAIVTAGVLIALAAQQWAEERNWDAKVRASRGALRQELSHHYAWAVEWRIVQPCLLAQVAGLTERVLSSGAKLEPAPLLTEDNRTFVMRLPSKDYNRGAYDSAIADGVASRFDLAFRSRMTEHYGIAATMVELTQKVDEAGQEQLALAAALPLDPSVRFQLVEKLYRLQGRIAFMDLLAGQMLDHIAAVGMIPEAAQAQREATRWGTYRFCHAQRLPLRSFADASRPVPN